MEAAKEVKPAPEGVLSASGCPPEKKRRRPVKRKSKDVGDTYRGATPPPTSTLIIDNGGHTLKYGWATSTQPRHMPNISAKLRHQWTVLVGDELERVQPNQLESTSRPTERGIITNLASQTQVWKRLLDNLGVIVPTTTEAAQTFGWKVARSSTAATAGGSSNAPIMPQSCAVLLLMPPHCPRTVLEQVMNVWFQDFHFAHVGFATAPVMAAHSIKAQPFSTACVVDMGWSATSCVPTHFSKPFPDAVRRMPLGGRHLIQLWKYYVSYRQWNLMDQEFLLEQVQRELGYVSLEFEDELRLARRVPLGRRPFDREFVLPDYSTTHRGVVKVATALQKDQQAAEAEECKAVATAEENDETQPEETGDEDKQTKDDMDSEEQDEEDSDDEEESVEAKRRRILQQRQEDQRRRLEDEIERQVLTVSVERFTIPEVLFRPTDAGLAPNLAGLPEAIVSSISASPRPYHAAMYLSIRLVGGLSTIPNLSERLEREIRCLTPCQYDVAVKVVDESPVDCAWLGAHRWLQQKKHSEWSISIDEWETSRKDSNKAKAWQRLLFDCGGAVV